MKVTPREKRRHAAGREKNEGLQTKPKLLNQCPALTTQNSDWLFHGNLSTSVKNASAAINTRHNHNFCQYGRQTKGMSRKIPNVTSLKPEQTQVVEALLAGKDVLAILPTGFGKRLIYRESLVWRKHMQTRASSLFHLSTV